MTDFSGRDRLLNSWIIYEFLKGDECRHETCCLVGRVSEISLRRTLPVRIEKMKLVLCND